MQMGDRGNGKSSVYTKRGAEKYQAKREAKKEEQVLEKGIGLIGRNDACCCPRPAGGKRKRRA
eukprot:1676536-Lingulodinium_polyedra.AAC.1